MQKYQTFNDLPKEIASQVNSAAPTLSTDDVDPIDEAILPEVVAPAMPDPIILPVYFTPDEKRILVDILNVVGNGKYQSIIQKLIAS